MVTKLFEIRDRATFIPALAIKLSIDNEDIKQEIAEDYLLARSGYGRENTGKYILLTRLEGGKCTYDTYDWGGSRTMGIAHQYIIDNFDTLQSGDVIDVEFILGETPEPKISEMYIAFDELEKEHDLEEDSKADYFPHE